MPRFADDSVQRVRDAIDMADLVEHYTGQEVGRDGKVLCCFHVETTASLSIDVEDKLFHCFGCGEQGDAVSFVEKKEGCDFRAALELLADRYRVELVEASNGADRAPAPQVIAIDIPGRDLTDAEIDALNARRGWTAGAIRQFGLKVLGDRVVIPLQDARGTACGYVRYQPNPDKRDKDNPKILAGKGSTRVLTPAPERVTGETLFLVEGEPDAIIAKSIGIPAVGIPGVQGWKPEWAPRFKGRSLAICLDCDDEGRALAERLTEDLLPYAKEIRVLDLGSSRPKGYDLTDAALEHREHYGDLRKLLYGMLDLVEPVKAQTIGDRLSGQRLQDWQEVLLRRVRGEEAPESAPIPLPFNELNDAMNGGVRPGQLIVVAGWTGHNKSNLADQILDSAAAADRSAHLYMTEMSLADRGDRFLARHSGVPFARLRRGQLNAAEQARAERAISRMRWPAMLVSDWTPEQVAEDILRGGWGLCVIDHLHDFPYRREEDLRSIVQLFAQTARTSTKNGPGTCIVLVCQLNDGQMTGSRSNERPRPGMHSLKGTSAIKQAADDIVFVWMEDDENGRATTSGHVWNVKGRMNGTAAVGVSLNVDRMELQSDSQWRPHAAGGYIVDPEQAA